MHIFILLKHNLIEHYKFDSIKLLMFSGNRIKAIYFGNVIEINIHFLNVRNQIYKINNEA